jgi:hypothetical protein
MYFYIMSGKLPIDLTALTDLLRRPIILRIVTILDITSLSFLELFEYGLTLKDVNYAMANGVITYENRAKPLGTEEVSALGIPLTGDYYYSFLNSKVKLTELGIHILDSIKTNQAVGDKVPMVSDEVSSDDGPRHAYTIG